MPAFNEDKQQQFERARELCAHTVDSLHDRDQLRLLFDEVWTRLSASELRELGPIAESVAHALFRYGSLATTAAKMSDEEATKAIVDIRRLITVRQRTLHMRWERVLDESFGPGEGHLNGRPPFRRSPPRR